MKRKMSTVSDGYPTRARQSIYHEIIDSIDLTRLTPSPGPSTSTIPNQNACPEASQPDLYSQLQNLEEQDGVIRNEEFLFCMVCDHFIDVYDGILLRNCLHQICIESIRKEIIDCAVVNVKCPIADCEYALQDREIRSLLTQEEFELHMDKNVEVETVVPNEQLYKELLDLEQQGLIFNNEPFECQICFTEIDVAQGIMIRECLHQYCKECIRSTINLSEEIHIKCPTAECSSFIHDREIHALLTPEEFDKYSMKTLRVAESQAPNSYHCKKANCEGWCFVDDEVNFFVCPRCTSKNCLPCQAIHTGRNCKEYQDDLRYAGMTDDQRYELCLDEIVKKNLGMRCTTCKIVIMKREGCDYLRCSMCKTELCWATKMARWGPGGKGDTSGGCRCTPLKRCHPNCRNCH